MATIRGSSGNRVGDPGSGTDPWSRALVGVPAPCARASQNRATLPAGLGHHGGTQGASSRMGLGTRLGRAASAPSTSSP